MSSQFQYGCNTMSRCGDNGWKILDRSDKHFVEKSHDGLLIRSDGHVGPMKWSKWMDTLINECTTGNGWTDRRTTTISIVPCLMLWDRNSYQNVSHQKP